MTSAHTEARQLAAVMRQQATQAGAETPAVRGANWHRAVVDTVGTDGTITTTAGIVALRAETYQAPAAGDIIRVSISATGSAVAEGRLAAATAPNGVWTALPLAAGFTPGQSTLDPAQFRVLNAWGQLRVELRGAFTATTTLTASTAAATFPVGARPSAARTFPVARNYNADSKGTVRVEISTAGVLTVHASASPNNTSWVCFDSSHFEL
ncbi:hypothetical protein [Streptomyces sp. NPDC059258]|uniref:hypothetical protein n=1 Tax=unclassified Streptomyces TaxID=2593676 RepID=UPI0036CC920D